jgi:hypothetical protein
MVTLIVSESERQSGHGPHRLCHDGRPMLHSRFVIADLLVGGARIDIRHGGLIVATRAESSQLDWEVVIQSIGDASVKPGKHRLQLGCIRGADDDDGRLTTTTFSGIALLVRTVGEALVFRGAGPLDGFENAMLGD